MHATHTPHPKQRETLRTALLSLWAMGTLVLIFCVGLLVYEMVQQGQEPLSLMLSEATVPLPESSDPDAITTRRVQLYFANAASTVLQSETRRIRFSEYTVENCRQVVEALIEGPRESLTPILPPATKIRGIYLLSDGELVVDFSRDLEAGQIRSATAEFLMVQGIVASITQPAIAGRRGPAVERVRFLFEGSPSQDTFPSHIDLSEPVVPDKTWAFTGNTHSDG